MKRLVIFDLDGTLAESKSILDLRTATLLGSLLTIVKVAIISGAGWPQFEAQVLSRLPAGCRLSDLSLLPTCGTEFYRHDVGWERLYSDVFSTDERDRIVHALGQALDESGFAPGLSWGPVIEDRGGQVTLSALGQKAPLNAKTVWDPDFRKRGVMKQRLAKLIPEFSVHLGGTTSIDVTKRGVDKAFGIRKLHELLNIEIADMIYVGDALFPGGNDFSATTTGAACIEVGSPAGTRPVIEAIAACLGG